MITNRTKENLRLVEELLLKPCVLEQPSTRNRRKQSRRKQPTNADEGEDNRTGDNDDDDDKKIYARAASLLGSTATASAFVEPALAGLGSSGTAVFHAFARAFEPEYVVVERRLVTVHRTTPTVSSGSSASLAAKSGGLLKKKSKKRKQQQQQQHLSSSSSSRAVEIMYTDFLGQDDTVYDLLFDLATVVDNDDDSDGRSSQPGPSTVFCLARLKLVFAARELWKRQLSNLVGVLSNGRACLVHIDAKRVRKAELAQARSLAAEAEATIGGNVAASAKASAKQVAADTATASPQRRKQKRSSSAAAAAADDDDNEMGDDEAAPSSVSSSSLLKPVISYSMETLFCLKANNVDHIVRLSPEYTAAFSESPFSLVKSIDRSSSATSPGGGSTRQHYGATAASGHKGGKDSKWGCLIQ